MRFDITQATLSALELKFKMREKESLIPIVPDGEFLCIRLDGLRITRSLLKDNDLNIDFIQAIESTVERIYFSFRSFLLRDGHDPFVCIFAAADEVSIVLSAKPNIYDGRIQKLTSIFAGSLSATASLFFTETAPADFREKKHVIVFDSRPILLRSTMEIREYVAYRYLVCRRYTAWRILRLRGYDVANPEMKADYDRIWDLIVRNSLEEKYLSIENHFGFWVPGEGHPFQKTPIGADLVLAWSLGP